ncbi:endonuclease/exonuclease/phosphatase family protein [Niabella ginsengisoli]|uniref:Endonuclease/exonuclease/phosphatase family protein n=1 Tax=Niabella ginsengisoli TaxID=522298 RepID=A0ABS9SFE6_9BACT|nr:endonuclease/exonuclease/phosphatase family protein [Niabella ginsengisoli]MCH5597083.1 endonuclease/exonuclease/phosphatase family protein [Niabella ginsengisoli]
MYKYLLIFLLCICTHNLFAQRITVMSYNIHHGADKDEKDRIEEMASFIKKSGADIIGLQEVDSVCTRSRGVDQMKVLSKLTGMHYAFVRHFEYQGGAYGMGVLSRYPITNIENIRMTLLKSKNPSTAMIAATIEIPKNRKIKFASAHFALDDSSRLVQARQVADYLNKTNTPLIFTGDLNATPDAKEIKYLKNILQILILKMF